MESIIRNVRDIEASDRHALEHVVGRSLRDDQRLTIQLTDIDEKTAIPVAPTVVAQTLPAWCRVYEGLSNEEIAEIERIALLPVTFGRSSD